MTGVSSNRWRVLAILFVARLAMAFQFQSIAAVSSVYMDHFGASLADIGLLIGLYLSPGIILALPGGAIGKRFGDRSAIAFGMALMLIGALIMILSPSWEAQMIGRILSGIGGVLLNVLMSKVVTDQFSGREIATAMGIFVNSWPVGIALALIVLPLITSPENPQAAQIAVLIFVIVGLCLFWSGTTSPDTAVSKSTEASPLRGHALWAVILAGLIWGLYNSALGMVFGFGPAMLVERGWSLSEASASTSIVLWLAAVSVPLGGYLADRTGKRDLVMVIGFLGFAALLCLAPMSGNVILVFLAMGLIGGISAGPIMSLPARVLSPGNRAVGMGVFFTLFYLCVVLAPIVAGHLSEIAGTARATFFFGAGMLIACVVALLAYNRIASQIDKE